MYPPNMVKCRLFALASSLLVCSVVRWLPIGGVEATSGLKTTSETIRARGFDVDEFDVVSQNYVLKIYRVINPLADKSKLHPIPVIATHGITFDIKNMIALSKQSRPRKPRLEERVTLYAMENGTDDRCLYFYLANNNYDVWLLEARGTNEKYQRLLKDPNDHSDHKPFWDFSLDEQALIDLPNQIEFVLNKTGAKKAAYIAYSQSTTLMFALLSMRPDFGERLTCFVATAPVVFLSNMQGLTFPLTLFKMYLQPFAARPMLPEWSRRLINFAATSACSISVVRNTLCRYIWAQVSGRDHKAMLEGALIDNPLKPTSFKTFEQYAHNAMIKDFRMYDYKDERRNMEEYGQPVPPAYNISQITFKGIVLFRGTNDYLSDPADQMRLVSRLRVPLLEDHVLEDYAHIDFIASPTVVRDINEPILRLLDRVCNRTVKHEWHTLGLPGGSANPNVVEELKLDRERGQKPFEPALHGDAMGRGDTPRQDIGRHGTQ